jgi:hypothetical protein
MMGRKSKPCNPVALLVMLMYGATASAHLGGDVSSVHADANALRAATRVTGLINYDVHEIDTAADASVREYVTRAGVVFAVSWSGPVPPDLHQLLAGYFPSYAAGIAALDHPGLHRSVRVVTSGLIVELTGHPRAYSGRAYLPALVPSGVDVANLH